MLEFALALVRVLVDIPCLVSSDDESLDDILHIDLEDVQERYRDLDESERRWIEDCWQLFHTIIAQQNQVHRAAMQLNSRLLRRIGIELSRRLDAGDEPGMTQVDVMREELWSLASRMSFEVLSELLDRARDLASRRR